MKHYLLFIVTLLLAKTTAFTQYTHCNEVFIPQGQLVLIHNPTKNEIALTEKEKPFLKKVGQPDTIKSGIGEMSESPYSHFKYKKNWFDFYKKGEYNTYEGLRHFKIEDTTFSIKDKSRNLSLKVGDGLDKIQKFNPGYDPNCDGYGGIHIYLIVNEKKRTELLDDMITVIVDRKTNKVTTIMAIYPE